MEDDFKVVVSISSVLWIPVVILMLLNVKEWEMMFWASFIPLIIALAVGTKLQAIITSMALQIKERNIVIKGVPLVTLSDDYFWFHHPRFVLSLIHFTLFQNAFQMIYFFWIWYSFGLDLVSMRIRSILFQESFLEWVFKFCVVMLSFLSMPLCLRWGHT